MAYAIWKREGDMRIAELEAALLPLAKMHLRFPKARDDATMLNVHMGIAGGDDLTFGHARHAAKLLGFNKDAGHGGHT